MDVGVTFLSALGACRFRWPPWFLLRSLPLEWLLLCKSGVSVCLVSDRVFL